jgi:ATP-dependent Clp protease, protease subunit
MREPIRVIEGTAKPHEPFWRFRDQAESQSGDVELEFFGPISEYSWFGDEVTPELFKKELYQKGAGKAVTVLVNSPGGEVIAASVIRSILQEYPGKVTVDIVGLAASAATVVVTGADHIRMRESALFMIHDPAGMTWGTIDEIKAFINVLKTVKDGIVDAYETKTKMDREKLSKLMTDETWMTAREAKDFGFIDEVVTGSLKKAQAVAVPAGFTNCLSTYMHVPESLRDQLREPVQSIATQNEPSEEERRLRSEILLLKGAKK